VAIWCGWVRLAGSCRTGVWMVRSGTGADGRALVSRQTFGVAAEAWLKVDEIDETIRGSYNSYVRRYLLPALGNQPVGKLTPRVLEEFYADLRRGRARCGGRVGLDDRVDEAVSAGSFSTGDRPG
jgi:integrase